MNHLEKNPRASLLLVDDEEIVLAALRETLRRENYDITAVADPIAALEVLHQRKFAAIITDQQMPQLTGLEFLAQAKTIQPDATRVLITAVLSLNTVIDSINKGEIYRFIVKPWLRQELLATVHNAVQRYDLVRRNEELVQQSQAANAALEAQLAIAAEQNKQLAALNSELRANLQSSVELCSKMLGSFWPLLGNQARRVQELCRVVANDLHLDSGERAILDTAALLHDVGLIGVPRELIKTWQASPEKLTAAEMQRIQQHPVVGQELIGFVQHLEEVGVVVRAHHERFDGQGYPDRLQGDGIPWLARLLGVAVAYASHPAEGSAALEFIRANSGTAFDPEAVRAFARSLPQAALPLRQREVLLSELRPGMILAAGIYTCGGLLLVSEGQVLSDPYIDKLRNHDSEDPITQSLIVYG